MLAAVDIENAHFVSVYKALKFPVFALFYRIWYGCKTSGVHSTVGYNRLGISKSAVKIDLLKFVVNGARIFFQITDFIFLLAVGIAAAINGINAGVRNSVI